MKALFSVVIGRESLCSIIRSPLNIHKFEIFKSIKVCTFKEYRNIVSASSPHIFPENLGVSFRFQVVEAVPMLRTHYSE